MSRLLTYTKSFLFLFVCTAFFSSCDFSNATGKVKKPRLTPKFGVKDKEPMGSYVAYHYLNSLFENGITDVAQKPFSQLGYELNYEGSLYVIIAKGIFMNKYDREAVLNYVSSGNTMLLSANYIDQKLLDTLHIDASFDFFSFLARDEYKLEKNDTWVSVANDQTKYGFYFLPFVNNVYKYDSSTTQVLGYNEGKDPNFVAVNFGKGRFVFHTAPAAFSNYFLLTKNNKEYLEKVFSYFDPATKAVYWDNYYRVKRSTEDSFSIFGFFKQHPPLFFAFLITMAALLLFIAFGGKRRQRFVPEKTANTNSTVSYTETIGRLYLQKKDNRNIALKMVTYFLEYVRTHYYLNTQTLNNEFAGSLSRKSAVPDERVKQLLQIIDETERSENISDIQLLQLHNLLQEYFKK